MKKMKKVLALTLSATMALGMSMTGMAAEPEVSVDAPIYAYDITNVIVPSTFAVAFNPDGLNVTKGGATDTSQIVSKNYGIINKSSKDKVITVNFEVEDLNEGKITFTDDPADVTNAAEGAYVVNLTMVPADTSEVKVGSTPASADENTAAADLADVSMTGATGSEKALLEGENEVDFLLEKAVYTGDINLDSATGNNVADDFTLTSLAAAGKGITAFTFGGSMNAKADWTKLTKGIKITAVYSNENAADGAATDSSTGALYAPQKPAFKTGSGIGMIKYWAGTDATDGIDSIKKVEMDVGGGTVFDGYNEYEGVWAAATDAGGKITLDPEFMSYYINAYPNDDVIEAIVTYETKGGTTKEVAVNVRLKEKPAVKAVSFTTGSAVGTINYVKGTGSAALASIVKIEMTVAGEAYDGYNAFEGAWAAATDSNGLITFDPTYMQFYVDGYPTAPTVEATVTYLTSDNETKTATVDVRLR